MASEEEAAAAAATISGYLATGQLKPAISKESFKGLESMPAAHEAVIEQKGGSSGKIVVMLSEEEG